MLNKSHPTIQFSVYGLLSKIPTFIYVFQMKYATIKLLAIWLLWDTFDIN